MRHLFLLTLCVALVITGGQAFAGFPLAKKTATEQPANTPLLANSTTTADDNSAEGEDEAYANSGHHGGHHGGGHAHFHGIAGHSHGHMHNSYRHHSSYHYHHHYEHYYAHTHNHSHQPWGTLSIIMSMVSLCSLLLWGSIAGISCAIAGTIFGLIGLFADSKKADARVGLLVCLAEAAILIWLYSIFII